MDIQVTTFWHILMVTLPAMVVFCAAYFLVRSVIGNETHRREMDMRIKNVELFTPLRLQAYERLILFLERIGPDNLLTRFPAHGKSVIEYQRELLLQIRSEFDHNLSQQIYVSANVWQLIRSTREQMAMFVNQAAASIPKNTTGEELNKKIFELYHEEDESARQLAMKELKKEVCKLY